MEKTYIELAVEAELKIKKLQAQLVDESEQRIAFDLSVLEDDYGEQIKEENAQTRAMIAELIRQKQRFENLRGEQIQDKKWFSKVSLSELERNVFLAIYEKQKSFKQVSKEFNRNVEELETIYTRAIRKIKRYLRGE